MTFNYFFVYRKKVGFGCFTPREASLYDYYYEDYYDYYDYIIFIVVTIIIFVVTIIISFGV